MESDLPWNLLTRTSTSLLRNTWRTTDSALLATLLKSMAPVDLASEKATLNLTAGGEQTISETAGGEQTSAPVLGVPAFAAMTESLWASAPEDPEWASEAGLPICPSPKL